MPHGKGGGVLRQFDVLVVGGGVAGLTAATEAARLGLRVGLVERHRIGGTSLWTGEVPTQALRQCATVAETARRAEAFGVRTGTVDVDFPAVIRRVQSVVRAIQPRRSPEQLSALGIEPVRGEAAFVKADTLAVGDEELKARRIVLATGSRPVPPDVDGLEETGYVTYESVWDLDRLPSRLAVLGGTPEGVELAQAFARLGSQVTLVEPAETILPSEDGELVERLIQSLRAVGIDVWTGSRPTQVLRRGDAKCVAVQNGDGRRELEVQEVLVAGGRVPNVEALALAATQIESTRTGIVVDRHFRTAERRVLAVGDVNGKAPWSRAAQIQALSAVRESVFPALAVGRRPEVAWAVFTDPELAHAGMTEYEARRRLGDRVSTVVQPLADVDRAVCRARTAGLVKLVLDRQGRLVGGHVLGPEAGEWLPALAWAVATRRRPGVLRPEFFAGATLSEGVLAAARQAHEARVYSGWRLAVLKWLARHGL